MESRISRRSFLAASGLLSLTGLACPKTHKITIPEDQVFLTFDDGPSDYMAEVLDLLKATGNTATFFVRGDHCESTESHSLLVRALNEGHIVGNHSYDHPNFLSLPSDEVQKQVLRAHYLIQSAYDDAGYRNPRLFRFPYLASMWPGAVYKQGYSAIACNIDPADFELENMSPEEAQADIEKKIAFLLARLRTGKVVLLHDQPGLPYTARDLMPAIFEAGFTSGAITSAELYQAAIGL